MLDVQGTSAAPKQSLLFYVEGSTLFYQVWRTSFWKRISAALFLQMDFQLLPKNSNQAIGVRKKQKRATIKFKSKQRQKFVFNRKRSKVKAADLTNWRSHENHQLAYKQRQLKTAVFNFF